MTPNDRVYIIAEAGVNHNGSLTLAKKLIDAAAESGADAVKFQAFSAEQLVTPDAPKAVYQTLNTSDQESQYRMLKQLELNRAAISELRAYAHAKAIDFFLSHFDTGSIDLAVELDLPWIKIPSGEITNAPLLLRASASRKPIILSTGMSGLGDIEKALGVLAFGYLRGDAAPSRSGFGLAYSSPEGQRMLRNKVNLMHCTTEYPTPFGDVHLRAMDVMRGAFSLPVGYSDHTAGTAVAIAAAARGAVMLEKHFTLDRSMPGPDHRASLQPDELTQMIQSIRQVEQAIGQHLKHSTSSEKGNTSVVRKSIVASRAIIKGDLFTTDNLTCKRPGTGISPYYYWDWLGRTAARDYDKDEGIG